jgi:subtilisin-like proprotein convertase family protein
MRTFSRRTLGTALCAVVLLAAPSTPAWSQPPGSLDTWLDACELPAPDLVQLLDKEALVVESGAVTPSDDAAFYTLAQQPYTHTYIWNPAPLCSASIFYGQPQVNGASFRSAVLVGPDLILTAWHNPVPTVPDVRVIFGLQYRQVGDSCIAPDFTHIPASHVFRPVEVVAWMWPQPDMLLLRLDRPVGAAPLRVRRSGQGRVGDAMTMIAHPDRLATKVDTAGFLAGNVTSGNGLTSPLLANMHTLVGSSGSMIYNRSERFVETVASGWFGTTYEACDGKQKVIHVDGVSSTNQSVRHFARFIPAFELLVQPLDRILHVSPVGGPPSDEVFVRTIRAPQTASGPIDYVITPPEPGPPPVVQVSASAPEQGTLEPGQAFTVAETVDVGGASCGVYERSYSVTDASHGYTDVVRHVFEIGTRYFTVDPPYGTGIVDVAPPFEDVIPFTLKNLGPMQYTVQVSADQPWVQLVHPGGDGPVVTLMLPPNGTASVGVTIDPLAVPPAGPTHVANLRFAADLGGCPGTAPLFRTFTFSLGHETFWDTPQPPVPVPDGSPDGIWRTINVAEDFCVGDVDVGVFVDGNPENLVVRLLSPQGELVTLWDHGSAVHGTLWTTFDDDGGGTTPVEWLHAIDGESGYGPWRLQVVDDVEDGNVATLIFWNVNVTTGQCF